MQQLLSEVIAVIQEKINNHYVFAGKRNGS